MLYWYKVLLDPNMTFYLLFIYLNVFLALATQHPPWSPYIISIYFINQQKCFEIPSSIIELYKT